MTIQGANSVRYARAEEGDFEGEEPTTGTLVSPEDAFGDANAELGKLPAIQAKVYSVRVVRPSRSGRMYLIKKEESGVLPEVGRIFLLKDTFTPVMAFRVVKTYPPSAQIAAKRVRVYPGFDQLTSGSQFRAYEKLGDIAVVPPQTAQDREDLSDLEGSGAQNDFDLEQTPPPETAAPLEAPPEPLPEAPAETGGTMDLEQTPPPAAGLPEEPALEPADDFAAPPSGPAEPFPESSPAPLTEVQDPGEQDVEIQDEEGEDEEAHRDYAPNWLTVAFGMFPNTKVPGSRLKMGGGILLARNIAYEIFSERSRNGDSLAIEGGFYYYKAAGDVTAAGTTNAVSKSYTLMPLTALARYNLPLSETLTFYLYGGLLYNTVIGNVGATDREIQNATEVVPGAGLGLFVQTGPNWYLRLNLGMESITGGVVLRF